MAWRGLFAGVVVAADRPPRAQGTVRRPLFLAASLLWAAVTVVGVVASARLVGPAFVLVVGFAGTMTLAFVCRRATAEEWVPATPRRRALAFAGAVAASAALAAAALGEPGASAGLAPGRAHVTLVVERHRPS
ncbi:MAG TPA: hypothetical protein VFJ97_11295 [Dermatophilaceae bacterium]|nr:hypothetical protein [Dermatophilaceae bacterium]